MVKKIDPDSETRSKHSKTRYYMPMLLRHDFLFAWKQKLQICQQLQRIIVLCEWATALNVAENANWMETHRGEHLAPDFLISRRVFQHPFLNVWFFRRLCVKPISNYSGFLIESTRKTCLRTQESNWVGELDTWLHLIYISYWTYCYDIAHLAAFWVGNYHWNRLGSTKTPK